MFAHIRVADGFRLQSAEQLVATGCPIIKGLTGNAAFPAPTVDLKTVQAAIDDLSAALAAQAHGGTAATAEKNNKRAALVALLRKHRPRNRAHRMCGTLHSIVRIEMEG
jgi:hypothetical protein